MILDLGHLHLRGLDVELRPLERSDAAALALASSESREHYRYNNVPNGESETAAYVERALKKKSQGLRYPFAIQYKGRIVGTTSYADYQPWEWPEGSPLQRSDAPDSVEIGYTWLAASAQRTGCNTEAKFLLLEQAFQRFRVHRVCLRTDVRNERSRRAIERLGCKLDGIWRAHMPGVDGTVRSSALYSMVAAEWPAARARLLELRQAR
jgi:RimJ/RimL family protein N-acetyltransferase